MLRTLILFLALSFSPQLFAASSFEVIEDRCDLKIETPDLAEQKVRKLRLENGLEVLLISDPNTHQSGAALAVGVGSWNDPKERPGMAHFVEHLLFLGTKKYPEEEGYSRYLDDHGGTQNAFTLPDRTVYMFSINHTGFSEALDRFGQFFIHPLFNPSGVDRECKAIHQEYCKNVPLDPWRVLHVKKELANPKHPFRIFSIGNDETLAKISQKELKQWYESYYSAHLMHLVVYSSKDLDALQEEVVPLFSAVKKSQTPCLVSDEPLFLPKKKSLFTYVTPIQDTQMLELTWELPRTFGDDQTYHTEKLISYVLGHEGSTSLLAQLKREELAEGLSSGGLRLGHDQALFTLSIHLTSKGFENIDEVVTRCFEAIASLKKSGIPPYLFEEVCQLEKARYRFQSRKDLFQHVSDLASGMVDEPLETFPQMSLIPTTYNSERVNKLLEGLTPAACHYTLLANTHHPKDHIEKWLEVAYTQIPIEKEKLEKWKKASPNEAIGNPRPNPFIPNDFSVLHPDQAPENPFPTPYLVSDDPNGKIYAAEDKKFLVPEVSWHFVFKTPYIRDDTPESYVFADLYCHAVDEALGPVAYEALLAGLTYNLEAKEGALELKIKGYRDRALLLLQTLLTQMKAVDLSESQFHLYYDQLAREYINSLHASPLKQGSDLLKGILYKDYAGLTQRAAALESANYGQMKNFCSHLLETCYVEGMLYGNMPQEQGEKVWATVKTTLQAQPYPKEHHSQVALAHLPANEHPAYLVTKSEHPANALILTADCGEFTFKKRAAQEILSKGLEEPFFSELRTKQQTAYIVTNWTQEMERHLYSFFAIQSSSHDTRDLLARFELFLESSLQHLADRVIPPERFEAIRQAHLHQLKNPVENLNKMGLLLHSLAFQYDGDFDWLEKRIQACEELSYDEFVQYAQDFLGKQNQRRLAIGINGMIPKSKQVSYRLIPSADLLRKEIHYQSRTKEDETL